MTRAALRVAARRILRAGLAAVEPGRLVRQHLNARGRVIRISGVRIENPQRLFVVSVGKAAGAMARSAHHALGKRLTSAIVIAPGPTPRMPRTRNFVAGHPVPDARGLRASRHVTELLAEAGHGDVVLLLLSGGASALMPAPIEGISLTEKQAVTRLLLRRGATIAEMNAVRKRLSCLKGGGFARLAAPARVFTLALSDVPGDDVRTIGSGPTVDDPGASALARRVARRYFANAFPDARRALERPEPRGGGATRSKVAVIGGPITFAKEGAREARSLGFRVTVRKNALRGEARRCGPALVRAFARLGRARRACLIATGETVVNVQGTGRGGRNQELALSSVDGLARLKHPTVLCSFATDGKDGPSKAAGGIVDDHTATLARRLGISPRQALDRNDSYTALRLLQGLVVTGATGTNVADVTVILG